MVITNFMITFLNVVPDNSHESVSVQSRLFVIEPKSVTLAKYKARMVKTARAIASHVLVRKLSSNSNKERIKKGYFILKSQ